MLQQIIAPDNALYLSEFLKELPKGILYKKSTGVGGTQLALTSQSPYIITVPTVELIKNKCYQHPHVLGVYSVTHSKVTLKVVKEYLQNSLIPKFLVTYDSLPKLISWLEELGINAYQDYKILVDEYHKILTDYSYRDKAIQGLLRESLKFKHYTFMSATPIPANFTPNELKNIDQYEIVWQKTVLVKPIRKKTNKPFQYAVNIIKNYKSNNYSAEIELEDRTLVSNEAYFFVNSVKVIKAILTNAELTPNEVKIICADNQQNRDELGEFSIDNVSDANKPFTFITSKSFLGVDIYSETGMTYIISSVSKKYTLLDISTDIFQIAGRIRSVSNPFRHTIFHIYNTAISDLTIEEFNLKVKEKEESTYELIKIYESLDVKGRKALSKRFSLEIDDDYIYHKAIEGTVEFNELKKLNEQFQFNVVNTIYRDGLSVRQAYIDAGFDLSNNQEFIKLEEEFIDSMTSITFKSLIKEYCLLIDINENPGRQKQLLELNAEIKKFVDILGTSRIRSLGFCKKNLKLEIYKTSVEVKEAVEFKAKNELMLNKFYSFKDLKVYLNSTYNNLRLDNKAKAVDIEKYFVTKPSSQRIDGKKVKGLVLLEHK